MFFRATKTSPSKKLNNKQTKEDEKNKEPHSFTDFVGLLVPKFAYEGITVKQTLVVHPALLPTNLVTTPPILKKIK